jgi:zinc metalloprotease ZmpA
MSSTTIRNRWLLAVLVFFVAGGLLSGRVLSAEKRLVHARQLGWARLQAHLAELRLDGAGHALVERRARTDERGITHVRYQQLYKGLEVFEGEAITHVDASDAVELTSSLFGEIELDTEDAVGSAAAVQASARGAGLVGQYWAEPVLQVLPRGERSDVDRLVWHVRVNGHTATEPTAQWDAFVDAKTGELVWAFDSLETTAAIGAGKTMYAGNVALNTDFASGTYALRDTTRGGGGGNYTCDNNNRIDLVIFRRPCRTFTRATNVFGNNMKNSTDRSTAAADAHYGLQLTWDYYKNTHGRNGIDGAGRRTYSRVHYGNQYENAFWSDSCFCMTYGDGKTTFFPLVSIDVAGHEMSHGVMSKEANLTYSGESGGLNESNSDIFGTLVEFSANNVQDPGDWLIGERIYRANWNGGIFTPNAALRYMDEPSRDGISPNCWSSSLGSLDVHYSSGPNNHMFYLLANGGASKCNGNVVSGIGRNKAGAIWYKAIADYMTASTKYAGARAAALNAAAALYGLGSAEYDAVAAAYAAINVS